MSDPEITNLLAEIRSGGKRTVAALLNQIEDRRPEAAARVRPALDALHRDSLGRGHVIGLTGTPGVGKSTLLSRLIAVWRAAGLRVGALAIDPSSRVSGGALLGDRVRLDYDVSDPGIFVRSMASRGEYGGLADRAFAGVVALRSAFDVTVLESVGVGQSEADIADLVDTTLLVIQPGSGDTLQFLKAGIMETPDLLVINKADQPEARRTFNDVRAALERVGESGGAAGAPVLMVSAGRAEGIEELAAAIAARRAKLTEAGGLERARRAQAAAWVNQSLRNRHGWRGVEILDAVHPPAARAAVVDERGPFESLEKFSEDIEKAHKDF